MSGASAPGAATGYAPGAAPASATGETLTRDALVVVASTRAAAGEYADSSGAAAVAWLRARGFSCSDAILVADADIPSYLEGLFADRASLPRVVLTSGGTGITAEDRTVAAVRPLLERELPGVVQEFFRRGVESVPSAVLSSAVAGTVGRTFVMTLPGSRGGVKDGLAVLDPLIGHIVDLLEGDSVTVDAAHGGQHAANHSHSPGTGNASQAHNHTASRAHTDSESHAHSESQTHTHSASHAHEATASHTHGLTDAHVAPHRGCGCGSDPSIPDPAYVAEQTGKVLHVEITDRPLEELLPQARELTGTAAMGAVVTFEGVVRDHDSGERVNNLIYTAHPEAEAFMCEVVSGVVDGFPQVRAWAAHRVGELAIGELAFVVVVASAHRAPAFEAIAEIAERVKAEVPIWKEQSMADGSTQWVGLD